MESSENGIQSFKLKYNLLSLFFKSGGNAKECVGFRFLHPGMHLVIVNPQWKIKSFNNEGQSCG